MSEEQDISPVTRLVPGVTVFALIVMIAAAIFHVALLSPKPAQEFDRSLAPDAPDSSTDWAIYPETQPEGGWARPWGVDLFWLADGPDGYLSGWNAPFDWSLLRDQIESESQWLGDSSLKEITYAPYRRIASDLNGLESDRNAATDLEREDVLSAFDHYLNNANQLRGFFLVGSGTGIELALDIKELRINGTPPLDTLFGGVIDLTGSMSGNDVIPSCVVSERTYPCVFDLSSVVGSDEKQNAVIKLLGEFGDHLDATAAKPAAPLPPIETIELAPIRRPGETDLE